VRNKVAIARNKDAHLKYKDAITLFFTLLTTWQFYMETCLHIQRNILTLSA